MDGRTNRWTDQPMDGQTDGPTKWGVESRSMRLKTLPVFHSVCRTQLLRERAAPLMQKKTAGHTILQKRYISISKIALTLEGCFSKANEATITR